jgi:hypothetical protein
MNPNKLAWVKPIGHVTWFRALWLWAWGNGWMHKYMIVKDTHGFKHLVEEVGFYFGCMAQFGSGLVDHSNASVQSMYHTGILSKRRIK